MALIAFLALAVLGYLAFLVYKFFKSKRKIWLKKREKSLLKERFNKNWSALLGSELVDGLSQMPEQWKSGIVPRSSRNGQELDREVQCLAKKIEEIATQCRCCGSQEKRSLLAVKVSFDNVLANKMVPFFASRDQMYTSLLLIDPSAEATAPSSSGKRSSVRVVLFGPKAGFHHWPANTTKLFKQIMYLLRDLDNMFKASYNQRFNLRVMDDELAAWTEWVTYELPKQMPEVVILTQTTSHLFELYREAAEVHAYFNDVFRKLAKQIGAGWHPAPLKNIFRIFEKAEHKSTSTGSTFFDCSKVFDIVRGTLVFTTLGDVQGGILRGVRALFACDQFRVIRVKDRFSNPTSACWRDVLINGRMVSSDGNLQPHTVEVQFHHKDLREERMNVGGHYIYERHRALLEACEMACGSEAGETLQNLHTHQTTSKPASSKLSSKGVTMQTKSGANVKIFQAFDKFQSLPSN